MNEGSSHTSSDDSDQSDSEIGAVGGVGPLNLAKDNPLLSLPRSANQDEANNHSAKQDEKLEASANHSIEETAVIETSQGADNSAFDKNCDLDCAEEEDEFFVPEAEVVFSEPNKKDEKKSNGVV